MNGSSAAAAGALEHVPTNAQQLIARTIPKYVHIPIVEPNTTIIIMHCTLTN